MKKQIRKQIGSLRLEARMMPESFDAEAQTCNVTWATSAPVLRQPFWGDPFYEVLSFDGTSVRMARINNGAAPLLDTHESDELEDVIGVVDKAWIENGLGMATVRFSQREEVQGIVADVKAGILRNISVGYQVYKYAQTSDETAQIPTLTAVDWEPFEISIVPIPADAAAQVRSLKRQLNECEFETEEKTETENQGEIMPPNEPVITEKPALLAEEARKIAADASQLAVTAERERATEIKKIVRSTKLAEGFGEQLISAGVSIEEARKQVIDELAKQDATAPTRSHVTIEMNDSIRESRMAAAENALLHRAEPKKHALTQDGRNFVGMSLLDLSRHFLEARGVRTTGMSRNEIAKRGLEMQFRGGGAESTSDLPSLLANVANKYLRQGYEGSPQTFWPIAQERTAADFKQISGIMFGDAPSLELVKEGGEIKRGGMKDSAEKYALATYAKIVAITRQVIINDDLNAITSIPMKLGQAAADLESDTVWNLFINNVVMSDGNALFSSAHKNYTSSGTALSTTSIGVARKLMRSQLNLQSRPLNLAPKFLLVSQTDESAAEQIVGPIVPNISTSVNPFSQKLEIVVEPRLLAASGAQPWYAGGDPSKCDMIHVAYLEGQQGAYMESRQGFDVDGLEIKCRLDFAAQAMDFRNLYKNAGV